jgi:hypothetical protein
MIKAESYHLTTGCRYLKAWEQLFPPYISKKNIHGFESDFGVGKSSSLVDFPSDNLLV